MQSQNLLTIAASGFLSVLTVVAQTGVLVINTPASLVECKPTLITWSGGVAPFHLTVFDGRDILTTLEDLGTQTGHSVEFTPTLPVGTQAGFSVRDASGSVALSSPLTIVQGDTTCLA